MDKQALKQTVGGRMTPQEIQQAAEQLRTALRDRRASDPPEDDMVTPTTPGACAATFYGPRKG